MKKEYRFEVYTDYSDYGDKVYVVKYFDLDNVIGVGDTIEDAIEEAKENLEVFLKYCEEKNIFVPEPSNHEENEYSGKVTLRMPKSLHRDADKMAENEGVSLNSFLTNCVSKIVYAGTGMNFLSNEAKKKSTELVNEIFEKSFVSFAMASDVEDPVLMSNGLTSNNKISNSKLTC